MSFLKNLVTQRTIRGQTVYNHLGQEVGRIINVRTEQTTTSYEIQSKEGHSTFTFPQKQFYQDGQRYYLLPPWLSAVQIAFSQIIQIQQKFTELHLLKDAFPTSSYLTKLTELSNTGLTQIEELMTYFTNFEEYLVNLNHEKNTILSETSQLMSLRLLTAGKIPGIKPELTRKSYSLKIIALKQRFHNVQRVIHFVSELHEHSQTSSKFIENLFTELQQTRAEYLSEAPQIQHLQARAANVSRESQELVTLLDGLMKSFINE
jgi:hypothetical protein